MRKHKIKDFNLKVYHFIVIALVASFIVGGGIAFLIVGNFLEDIKESLLSEESSLWPRTVVGGVKKNEFIYQQPKFSPQAVNIYKKKQAISSTNFLSQLYTEDELLGGGMVLTSDGWLISYTGLVGNYTKNDLVVFFVGRTYGVEKIVSDPASEAAFIKIEAQNLPVNTLGNEKVEANEPVFVASRSGLTNNYVEDTSYFLGTDEEELIRGSEKYYNFILLQQPMEKKIVGSPVFNREGEVLGILSDYRQNRAVIPLSHFSGIIAGFLRDGQIKRPYLGVKFIDLSDLVGINKDGDFYTIRDIKVNSLAGAFLYASPNLVEAVESNSPAASAKLQPKDLIIKVENVAVNKFNDLTSLIQEYSPGRKIKLTVLRAGEDERVVEVQLSDLAY